MAQELRQGYCKDCEQYGPVTRKGISHILHLLLTLLTAGIWLLVWIALALLKVGGWRCQRCGSDRVEQVGDLFSLRGWLLLVIAAPFLVAIAPDLLGPSMGGALLLAIPLMLYGSYRQRKKRQEGIQRQKAKPPVPPSLRVRVTHNDEPIPGSVDEHEAYRGVDAEGDHVAYNDQTGQFSVDDDDQRPHWQGRETYIAANAEHAQLVATFQPAVRVRFAYEAATSVDARVREVDVTKLLRRGSHLYLQGWCNSQEDERMFRTDRIVGSATVEATGESIGMQILATPARLQMALMAANVL